MSSRKYLLVTQHRSGNISRLLENCEIKDAVMPCSRFSVVSVVAHSLALDVVQIRSESAIKEKQTVMLRTR